MTRTLRGPERPPGVALQRAEVRAALAGLGYGVEEVREAVACLPDDGQVEDLLKAALRQLAAAR